MIVAIPVYIMIFWLCTTLEIKNTYGLALWIERITLLIIFIGSILIGYNYLGVQKHFPPCRSQNKVIKIIGIIGFIAVFTSVALVIMIFIEGIFFNPAS